MARDVTMSVGVFTVDRELVVRSWDVWLAEATGIPAEAACGRELAALFPDLAQRRLLPVLRRVVDQGAVEVLAPAFHHYLIPCRPRADSAEFERMQQHVTMSPLRAGHFIDGAVITIEDVTSRIERERRLAVELRSHDDAIRQRAATTLAREGHTTLLTDALGDESWRIRRAAAHGMATAGGHDAVLQLVRTIRDRHRDVAALNAAIDGLVKARADAVPAVLELLAGGDADVRTYVALTLGLLGDRRAVGPLLGLLNDADANVKYHAIEALGRIGAPEASEALTDIAESRDFSVAFAALDALAAIGDPLVEPRLLSFLDDDLLGAPAADALGKVGSEEVVVPLAAALLRDTVPATSLAAALAAIHDRLEGAFGIGALVVDLARTTVDADGARRLVAAVPKATDDELEALATVLSWLAFPGVDEVLASLLAHPRVRPIATDVLALRGDGAVSALLGAFAEGDRDVRQAAATALGRAGTRRAADALVQALRRDPDEVIVAAAALAGIGDPRAFEPLLEILEHPDTGARQAAVAALNSLAHPDTRARIVPLLDDASPRRRESATRIAGYFAFPEALEPMLALCDDADLQVRRAALEHVVLFDDPRVGERLRAALASGDAAIRAAVARAVANLDADDWRDLLLRCCDDRDLWVRYFAARSSARRQVEAPEILAALLRLAEHDPAPPVRVAAVEALGTVRCADALPILIQLTADPDGEVENAAVAALGAFDDDAASATLLAMAAGDDVVRAQRALAALLRPGVHAPADAVARLAASDHKCIRSLALRLLARIGSDEAIAALVSLTGERVYREDAVAALAEVADLESAPMARGLRDADPAVRRAVVEALARTRNPRATPHLVQALSDESPHVRFEAMRALGRMTLGDSDRATVAGAGHDDNAAVRLLASRTTYGGRRAQVR